MCLLFCHWIAWLFVHHDNEEFSRNDDSFSETVTPFVVWAMAQENLQTNKKRQQKTIKCYSIKWKLVMQTKPFIELFVQVMFRWRFLIAFILFPPGTKWIPHHDLIEMEPGTKQIVFGYLFHSIYLYPDCWIIHLSFCNQAIKHLITLWFPAFLLMPGTARVEILFVFQWPKRIRIVIKLNEMQPIERVFSSRFLVGTCGVTDVEEINDIRRL